MDLERINELLPRHHRRFLRRALERLLAVVGLVVCSPILILLIFVVRLGSRGPAILRQERIGLNGKPFTMYKLRSMYENAESNSGAVWASDNDPRVTPVGRFLRKLHLDELPQLFNVAAGEMSFVGPRPERPVFVEQLSREIPGYAHRLAVLPGVTGLAQINLDPDQTVDCVRRKLELDLLYIFAGGWDVDLRIALCTALRMLCVPRRLATRMMMLSCEPEVRPVAAGPRPHFVDRAPRPTAVKSGRAQREPIAV